MDSQERSFLRTLVRRHFSGGKYSWGFLTMPFFPIQPENVFR